MKTTPGFSLENQTALITGGGSGLGLGIARCMSDSGARVILAGRNEEKLRTAAENIGPSASFEVYDVTQTESAPELVSRIEKDKGPIDILVNNAGNHLKKSALETSDDEFQRVMQTHVNGSFALSRESGKTMIRRGRGSILFIASMASYLAVPMVSAYSAAKTAHIGLVRSLAAELSPHNVRVNGIAPGFIQSDMLRNALRGDPEREKKILSRTPLSRFGDPEEIGWAAVYLCSPSASFVTGTILPVDGGAHVGF